MVREQRRLVAKLGTALPPPPTHVTSSGFAEGAEPQLTVSCTIRTVQRKTSDPGEEERDDEHR